MIRRRPARPSGGKVRAAQQRDSCDDNGVVSDVSRRNGFSGDEAGGLDVELEHGLRDPRMNVGDDDPVVAPARSVNIVE
jgi:hypothetical protein